MLPKPSLGPPESSLLPLFSATGLGNLIAQSWDVTSGGTRVPAVFQKWKKTQHSLKVKSQKGVGQVPHTNKSHSGTTPALCHQLTPAAERKALKSPSHPWVFQGCVSSWLASSPFKLYKPELPPWLCVQRVSLCLHCFELFANFWEATPLSTPLGLCKGGRDYTEPLVIHFSTGELIDLTTKVCTVLRALNFSKPQLQAFKKITINISIKTQNLLSEEKKSVLTQ